jgi:uncharacterized surface protein with fasciclin (FAS1) repeats
MTTGTGFTRVVLAAAAALALAVPASADARTDAPAVSSAKSKNIVETAVAAGKFKTLASLLTSADLAGTLQGKGPFTVFAPTDAAFKKVPKATLDGLAKDKAKLRSVLLLHVASGRLPASSVVKRSSIKTLNGQTVRVRVRDGKVFVGAARVTSPDVKASNGVIHVIDKVLLPR